MQLIVAACLDRIHVSRSHACELTCRDSRKESEHPNIEQTHNCAECHTNIQLRGDQTGLVQSH